MKTVIVQGLKIFLGFWLLNAAVPGFAAVAADGQVLDVFNGKVTVQMAGEGDFQKGDRIDLSYMAGPMEMLIGQYEVIQTNGPIVFAREVSLSMPPIKDMKVRVVSAQPEIIVPNTAAMDPVERDPRFLEANTRIKEDAGAPVFAERKKAAVEEEAVVDVLGPNEGLSATAPLPPLELLGETPPVNPKDQQYSGNGPYGPLDTQDFFEPSPAPGRYWLGIEMINNDSITGQVYTAAPIGVRVVSVLPRSAAEESGIKPSDVISVINNIPVEDTWQFISILNQSGGKIYLEIQRNGQMIQKTVVLQERALQP